MPENFAEYITKAEAATNNRLMEDEVDQVVTVLKRHRRLLEREGEIDNLDQRLAEIAIQESEKIRLSVLLQKQRAHLATLAHNRTRMRVDTLFNEGLSPEESVLALFEGRPQDIRHGWHSIYATRLAFEVRYVGDLTAEVLREVPEALKLVVDPEFSGDIVREMFELRDGGEPGRSGNPDARKVARIFAHYGEVSRRELNELGAAIDAVNGLGCPHAHDAIKMLRVPADVWVRRIATRLDLSRTLPDATDDEAIDFLRALYATLTTGRNDRPVPPTDRAQGQRDPIRMLPHYPVLCFRTSEDWLAYQAEFGQGNIWTGMLSHQRKIAAIAAEMQLFGPVPGATIGSLYIADSAIRQSTQEASGLTVAVSPAGFMAGELLAGQRATRSMAKFGGAIVDNVADLVTHAYGLKYQGRSFFVAYHEQLLGAIKTVAQASASDTREIAYLLGEGMDGMLDSLNSSIFAGDSRPGGMSSAIAKFLRWSRLTARSDSIRAAGARMVAAHIGSMSGRAWNALPQRLRSALGRHGLAEGQWQLVQQSAFDGPNGDRYVTPDRVAPAIAPPLRRFYAEEVSFNSSLRQPGTVVGELLRALVQIKGSPLRILPRDVTPHIGHLLAGMMMAGYTAVAAKGCRSDYEWRRFVNADGSGNRDALLAGFIQSGGAGFYADYLFGQVARFESGISAEFIETFIAAREGHVKAGNQLHFILQNTPFANLSYARPALDFLILNELRELISPGFLDRQRRSHIANEKQSLLYPRPLVH